MKLWTAELSEYYFKILLFWMYFFNDYYLNVLIIVSISKLNSNITTCTVQFCIEKMNCKWLIVLLILHMEISFTYLLSVIIYHIIKWIIVLLNLFKKYLLHVPYAWFWEMFILTSIRKGIFWLQHVNIVKSKLFFSESFLLYV